MDDDRTGTQDDNTMTIEGDGALYVSTINMPRDSGLPKGASTIHPCERFGHHPKYIEEDGQIYQVKPRTCRHCGANY